MQDCFRKYPEEYGSEIADDKSDEAPAQTPEGAEAAVAKTLPESPSAPPAELQNDVVSAKPEPPSLKEHAESEVPKEAFDATSANKTKEQ
jgi:intermembrane space import and assembly protein 40